MAIFRDPRAATMWLLDRFDRERGQSLVEYGLILAVVVLAAVAVLGVVGSTVSDQLASVTAALQGEGKDAAFRVSIPMSLSVASGVLAIGAVGLFLLRMRRD